MQVESSLLLEHIALLKHRDAYADFCSLLAQYVDLSVLGSQLMSSSTTDRKCIYMGNGFPCVFHRICIARIHGFARIWLAQ